MGEYGNRSFEIGKRVSYQSGAEYQANPGTNRREYLNDSAIYFRKGVKTINDLTPRERTALMSEFNRGVAAEKKLQ